MTLAKKKIAQVLFSDLYDDNYIPQIYETFQFDKTQFEVPCGFGNGADAVNGFCTRESKVACGQH